MRATSRQEAQVIAKSQPKKILAVVEPGTMDDMTDEELDTFADDLFDKVQSRWENGK